MLDSDRNLFAALGLMAGISIAFNIVGFLSVGSDWVGLEKATTNTYTYAEEQCARQQGQRSAQASSGIGEGQDIPSADPQSDQGDAREEGDPDWCDLAAQQSMADATFGMEQAAWVALGLTAVGVVLVWGTLLYTRQTLSEARRATEAQMRPWVMFSNIRVYDVRAIQTDLGEKVFITWAVSADVTNSGAGAATRTRIFAASCATPELYEFHDQIVAGELAGGTAGGWTGNYGPILLAPDAKEKYSCRLSVHTDARTPDKPMAMDFSFYLVAKYIAVIGDKEHVTSQSYIVMDDRMTSLMPSIERLNESRAASALPFGGNAS